MGLILKHNNILIRDVIKGYAYVSSAEVILTYVTRIFKLQGNTE